MHPCAGSAGGLGWGGNVRFRTGLNLIDLTAEVSSRLSHVTFPFMIMHDPADCESRAGFAIGPDSTIGMKLKLKLRSDCGVAAQHGSYWRLHLLSA